MINQDVTKSLVYKIGQKIKEKCPRIKLGYSASGIIINCYSVSFKRNKKQFIIQYMPCNCCEHKLNITVYDSKDNEIFFERNLTERRALNKAFKFLDAS